MVANESAFTAIEQAVHPVERKRANCLRLTTVLTARAIDRMAQNLRYCSYCLRRANPMPIWGVGCETIRRADCYQNGIHNVELQEEETVAVMGAMVRKARDVRYDQQDLWIDYCWEPSGPFHAAAKSKCISIVDCIAFDVAAARSGLFMRRHAGSIY